VNLDVVLRVCQDVRANLRGNMNTQRNSIGRAAWMQGGWGLMHHYNKSGTESLNAFNEQTDRFDVETLARQLQELGCRWFIICVCHNATSRYWCAPNSMLDRCAPVSVCSGRDLIADLAEALGPLGIRTMVYVWPWHEGQKDAETQHALAVDYPARWCQVLEEYSLRWGKQVSGWWVDGASVDSEPNLARLAAALRAGNPDAALSFNGGWGKLDKHSASDDYCGGEHLNLPPCPGQEDDGALRHLLNPIGGYWGGSRDMVEGVDSHPELKFSDERLAEAVIDWTIRNRAAVTLDVPLQSYKGTIGSLGGILPDLYYRQLKTVAERLRSAT
jgi:hypothetical protein